MADQSKLALAEWVMDCALKNGADEIAVSVSDQKGVKIVHRDGQLEELKESSQRSLGIAIYSQQRYSSHSTNDLRQIFLSDFIKKAVAMTGYLAKDAYRSLPDPKYYPDKSPTDLKLCDENYDRVTPSERIRIATEIEVAAKAQSDQIISVSARYSDASSESVKIHSNGLSVKTKGTVFSEGAEVTVRDQDGARPEGGFGISSRFHSELAEPEIIGKNASFYALRKIGQKKIESGVYDMIVENRVAGRLIARLRGPMSGGTLQQKNSFLEGMLGKKIASEKLTMTDDPFIEKGFGSRFFDGEGLAARKRVMIEKGLLRHYYIDTYYGKKLGMEPTSGSASNTVFECGSRSPDEMISDIRKGILVTGFIGGNANSTTGDFSFGIIGLLIENGAIVRPVNEMNISGNTKDLWYHLADMGNDPFPYSGIKTPSMCFEHVNFSGL